MDGVERLRSEDDVGRMRRKAEVELVRNKGERVRRKAGVEPMRNKGECVRRKSGVGRMPGQAGVERV